jgi:hypothetical protein
VNIARCLDRVTVLRYSKRTIFCGHHSAAKVSEKITQEAKNFA